MHMTEDEARKKWCPHVRFGNEAGCNRNTAPEGSGGALTNCIASECMAWRWAWVSGWPDHFSVTHGYCGLAGALK